jgi:LPS sulfotransferase NodH
MRFHSYKARITSLSQVFAEEWMHAQRVLAEIDTHATPVFSFGGRAYFLCMTPRSGSSYLADVLQQTKTVGDCAEHFPSEYGGNAPVWMTACRDLRQVLETLQRSALPSPWFGIKGSLLQFFPLIAAGVFGNPTMRTSYLYLRREDLIAQAISLSRAAKSGEWHSTDAHVADPEISMDELIANLRLLRRMEADWEVIFTVLGISPLRLSYEQCLKNPNDTFESIRKLLGVSWQVDPGTIQSRFSSLAEKQDPQWRRRLYAQLAGLAAD